MKKIKGISEKLTQISPESKRLIKLGILIFILLYSASLFFYICAGREFEYYFAMRISSELANIIKPSMGIIMLGVILFESVSREEQ